MNSNLVKIEREEVVKSAFLGKTYTSVSFVVKYKDVEINRFQSIEAAEECAAIVLAIPDDTVWAYENSLREMGAEIPR